MRLGLNLGYWGAGADADALGLVQEAERLGFAVAWAAEAYGSDAATVLSWVAARTTRIDVGSAVFQIPARTPALTAMTAATLDALSGGRFRLGLGVSGPQVSEAWHGVRFDPPLPRTREYVEVVRTALRREPVAHAGEHYPLPLPGGAGRPLRLTVHPVRAAIPLYLAAVGPRSLELAGEIADGWLAVFFAPEHAAEPLARIAAGRARAAAEVGQAPAAAAVGRGLAAAPAGSFDVAATVPLAVDDDLGRAADTVRDHAALYLGGMGSRTRNFYADLATRMGYGAAAAVVQDRYLAGDRAGAAAAVPERFLAETALIGPPARIRDRLQAYAQAGVGTLSVLPTGPAPARTAALRTLATALDDAGVAS